MRVREIVWLDVIEDKIIRKHGVRGEEVEEVLKGDPRCFFVEHGHVEGEDLYLAMGRTSAGRLLVVYFVLRPKNQALVISARNATQKEKKKYERK